MYNLGVLKLVRAVMMNLDDNRMVSKKCSLVFNAFRVFIFFVITATLMPNLFEPVFMPHGRVSWRRAIVK